MLLTLKQIIEIHSGVQALSGLETQGQNPIRLVFKGVTRYRIARNAKTLGALADAFQKSRDALVEKYGTVNEEAGGQKTINPNSESFEAFKKEAEEILSQQEEVNLHTFTLDELDLDKNPIPISVLDSLMAIITE